MRGSDITPIAGDIWESKRRKGYTVVILEVKWIEVRYGRNYQRVTYRTNTTPAKRPNLIPGSTDIETFHRNFRKHYDMEELMATRQYVVVTRTEEPGRSPQTHTYGPYPDRKTARRIAYAKASEGLLAFPGGGFTATAHLLNPAPSRWGAR